MVRFSRVLILLLLSVCAMAAGELQLDERESYRLGLHLSYFEDAKGDETIDSIPSREFTPVNEAIPSFGFTDSVYWFRITLTPSSRSPAASWWLQADYALLEEIDLYGFRAPGDRPALHVRSGRLLPYRERQLAQRQFVFSLETIEEPLTLYIRVKTQSSMQVPLQLKTSKALYEDSQYTQLLFGLYYGVFAIIILYNLIMYNYTKENDYLRYLFFLASFIGWQMTLDGFGIQYLWTEWQWMIEHGGVFFMGMGLFSSLLFSRYFLRTWHTHPPFDRFLNLFTLGVFLLLPFTMFLSYGATVPLMALLSIIIPLFLLVLGILVWRRHYRPARFYVLGWSAFLLGSVVLALNKLNIIHGFYLLNYAQQFGSALQMIFLSWALADRVKLLQDEYVEKLNGLNAVLHAKVTEALEKTREKDKIMMNQARLAALGEMLEQIAHQWRQPLNTMALLNQDIYFKHKLGNLNAADIEETHEQINNNLQYMSKTIDDFRNLHLSDKGEEPFSIEEVIERAIALNDATLKFYNIACHLHSEHEHQIYSSRNELIQILMNLLKNSRDAITSSGQKHGKIVLTVQEKGDDVNILVEDNGGGIPEEIIGRIFDPYFTTKGENHGSGIGLFMSKTIIQENLKGTIRAENSDAGARFVITIPRHAHQRMS